MPVFLLYSVNFLKSFSVRPFWKRCQRCCFYTKRLLLSDGLTSAAATEEGLCVFSSWGQIPLKRAKLRSTISHCGETLPPLPPRQVWAAGFQTFCALSLKLHWFTFFNIINITIIFLFFFSFRDFLRRPASTPHSASCLCLVTSSTLQHLSAVPADAPAHATRGACTDIVSDKRSPAGFGPDTHPSPYRGALAIVQHGQHTSTSTCTGAHTIPARQTLTHMSTSFERNNNKNEQKKQQNMAETHFLCRKPTKVVFLSLFICFFVIEFFFLA